MHIIMTIKSFISHNTHIERCVVLFRQHSTVCIVLPLQPQQQLKQHR